MRKDSEDAEERASLARESEHEVFLLPATDSLPVGNRILVAPLGEPPLPTLS